MAHDPLSLALMEISERLRREEPDAFAVFDAFAATLRSFDVGSNAPPIGATMPEFMLTDSEGVMAFSKALLAKGPLVLSFIRGGWCEYCSAELQVLAQTLPQISEAGGQVVAVSAEVGGLAARNRQERQLPFPMLSDIDFGLAMTFGLLVPISPEIVGLYRDWGVDFVRIYGYKGPFLPIPATFVVASDGRIVARHVDPDFRVRMPVNDILAGLRAAGRSPVQAS